MGAIILAALIILWACLRFLLRSVSSQKPILIGHRGLAGLAPENTAEALKCAIDRGVLYIEIDVQRSADGILMLMHDRTVDRTTNGHGKVAELEWKYLEGLDVGLSHSGISGSAKIPKFTDVLALIAQTRASLLVEAKNPKLYPGIEHQIAEKIREYELESRIIVISFNRNWLWRFSKIGPGISLGALAFWYGTEKYPAQAKVLDVNWISTIVDPTLIYRAHKNGYKIFVWTVDNPILASFLRWAGVDGITSNHLLGDIT